MAGFSLGDLISGKKKGGELTDLFSQKTTKAEPGYDYSVVPARGGGEPEEVEEEDKIQNARKQKKIEKKKRKALETEQADAAKTQSKKRRLTSDYTENAPEPDETMPKVPNTVRKEDENDHTLDPEKEKRTVFVGNLPIAVKEKMLKKMFYEFGTVECVRFRSAARPDLLTTKKVAVIKQVFHEERKNINAYVRFSTEAEAVKSCSLNGTEVEGHALRVDMSLNSKVHEQNKAIFIGNLDFKTHEDDVRTAFESCGEIVDVRLVRDSSTGIGKGFGYVNFELKSSVETALTLDGSEVCGRKIRVTRSVRKPKGNMPVKGGPNQRNNAPNQRNFGPNQRNNGPDQRNNGPHQRNSGPHQRNNGPIQRNGPNQRNNGPIQRNNGPNQRNNGRFAPPAPEEKVSFKEKFEDKKNKFTTRVVKKNFKKKGGEATKAFQGVSTTDKVEKKPRLNKQELKKLYIAKKLMS